jgi:2-(1,2-epoxy-1,2-dihydrophenyl)acetyl-CoA isomerase
MEPREMALTEAVRLEVNDGIAILTLNRPEQLNAVNYALLAGFIGKVGEAVNDPQIGCIVVTGAGRAFCSGGDLKEGARPPKDTEHPVKLREGAEACRLLREAPMPTIAMVNGPVAGAGIGIAGSCDIRFAAQSATFVSAYDRVGGAGDYGASYVWTRALGSAKARQLFLLGEKFTAEEALAFGLYTRVYPDSELHEATMFHARRFAEGPRPAWRYMKENLNAAEAESFGQHLDRESVNQRRATSESNKYLIGKRHAEEKG